MKHNIINLAKIYSVLKQDVYLTSYCQMPVGEIREVKARPAVLLFPGGAYAMISKREGEPVALRLLAAGINVFLLEYNVGPYTYPEPLPQGFAALNYIRTHAEEYNIDPNKIIVMGFSAGGHFAAALSAFYTDDYYAKLLNVPKSSLQINGTVLSYPVISMIREPHLETKANITRDEEALIKHYSIETQVTNKFPKTFIWTTHEDDVVSSNHSLLLANSLRTANVPFELHYYPVGDHGSSVADRSVYGIDTSDTYIEKIAYFKDWINLAIKFIHKII